MEKKCVCVKALIEAGELSRAAAVVVQQQSLQTTPGTLAALKALFPPAPLGDGRRRGRRYGAATKQP